MTVKNDLCFGKAKGTELLTHGRISIREVAETEEYAKLSAILPVRFLWTAGAI